MNLRNFLILLCGGLIGCSERVAEHSKREAELAKTNPGDTPQNPKAEATKGPAAKKTESFVRADRGAYSQGFHSPTVAAEP